MAVTLKHPAKFSEPILDRIGEHLDEHGWPQRILDPFAGVGRVHRLPYEAVGRTYNDVTADTMPFTVGVEVEYDWAANHARTIVGNALELPFADDTFDGLVTSPCYGNRLADHHKAQDGSIRHSYTHDIGHRLHLANAGKLQWGPAYKLFHHTAWKECLRVLQPKALIVINVSNHIRAGEEQLVTEWHLNWFLEHDCQIVDLDRVVTSRMRYGANREARVRYENLFVLRYLPVH